MSNVSHDDDARAWKVAELQQLDSAPHQYDDLPTFTRKVDRTMTTETVELTYTIGRHEQSEIKGSKTREL